tara:strand:+ start:83 stop:553 length:471 start_codon:yes stop_codon:yes gene_type:complete
MEIEGHTDYIIYPDGKVWSQKSNIFLKPFFARSKYHHVDLEKNILKVHRLIAQHYIPNEDNKPQVDHINRNKTDNRVENLRWATAKENSNNRTTPKTNTSGHKYITYEKRKKLWQFQKMTNVNGKRGSIKRRFKKKTDALCYKFIFLLNNRILLQS